MSKSKPKRDKLPPMPLFPSVKKPRSDETEVRFNARFPKWLADALDRSAARLPVAESRNQHMIRVLNTVMGISEWLEEVKDLKVDRLDVAQAVGLAFMLSSGFRDISGMTFEGVQPEVTSMGDRYE